MAVAAGGDPEVPQPTPGAPVGTMAMRMHGSVAVGLVFVDGPTPDLQWSTTERQNVEAKTQHALSWWNSANREASMTFSWDIHVAFITVAPNPSAPDLEALWRDPTMVCLGYSGDVQGITNYLADLRKSKGTTWSYMAFFHKYPPISAGGAYAYVSRSYVVMSPNYQGWGPDNIDKVFAHETGHIFEAPDEYASSHCTARGAGPWSVPNLNCENCAGTASVECIMRNNSWAYCSWTPSHVGWESLFLASYSAATGTYAILSVPDPTVVDAGLVAKGASAHARELQAGLDSGWQLVEPFPLASSAFQLRFKFEGGKGTMAIDKLTLDGVTKCSEVWAGSSDISWSIIRPAVLGSNTLVVQYSLASGSVAVSQVNAGGQGLTSLWKGEWKGASWACVEPFVQSGALFVLKYASNGGYQVDMMDPDSKELLPQWEGTTVSGCTAARPIVMTPSAGSSCKALCYNSSDGHVETLDVDLAHKKITPLWNGVLAAGFTAVEPIVMPRPQPDSNLAQEPVPLVLMYNTTTGTLSASRFQGDWKGFTPLWESGAASNIPDLAKGLSVLRAFRHSD